MAGPKLELGIDVAHFQSKLAEVDKSLREQFPDAVKRSEASLKAFSKEIEHINDPTAFMTRQIQSLTQALNSGRIAPEEFKTRIAQLNDKIQNSSKYCSEFSQAMLGVQTGLVKWSAGLVGVAQAYSFMKDSTQHFAEFETGMKRVETAAQATASQMRQVQEVASSVSRDKNTQFASKDAFEGLESLGKAGVKFKDQMQLLPSVLNLAANEMENLGVAADATATLMNQFSVEASHGKDLIDLITKGANASAQRMPQMIYMLQEVAGIAKTAGATDLDIVLGASAMAQKGFPGAKGNEAYRGFYLHLESLQKPTREESLLLAQLGLTTDDLNIKTQGLIGVIDNLNKSQMSGAIASKLFGEVVGGKMMSIIKDGAEPLRKLKEGIEGAADANTTAAGRFGETDRAIQSLSKTWTEFEKNIGQSGLVRVGAQATDAVLRSANDVMNPSVKNQLKEAFDKKIHYAQTLPQKSDYSTGYGYNAAMQRISDNEIKLAELKKSFPTEYQTLLRESLIKTEDLAKEIEEMGPIRKWFMGPGTRRAMDTLSTLAKDLNKEYNKQESSNDDGYDKMMIENSDFRKKASEETKEIIDPKRQIFTEDLDLQRKKLATQLSIETLLENEITKKRQLLQLENDLIMGQAALEARFAGDKDNAVLIMLEAAKKVLISQAEQEKGFTVDDKQAGKARTQFEQLGAVQINYLRNQQGINNVYATGIERLNQMFIIEQRRINEEERVKTSAPGLGKNERLQIEAEARQKRAELDERHAAEIQNTTRDQERQLQLAAAQGSLSLTQLNQQKVINAQYSDGIEKQEALHQLELQRIVAEAQINDEANKRDPFKQQEESLKSLIKYNESNAKHDNQAKEQARTRKNRIAKEHLSNELELYDAQEKVNQASFFGYSLEDKKTAMRERLNREQDIELIGVNNLTQAHTDIVDKYKEKLKYQDQILEKQKEEQDLQFRNKTILDTFNFAVSQLPQADKRYSTAGPGQAAGSIIGAGAGYYFSGGNPVVASAAATVGNYVGGVVFPGGGDNTQTDKITDAQFTQSYGQFWVKLWESAKAPAIQAADAIKHGFDGALAQAKEISHTGQRADAISATMSGMIQSLADAGQIEEAAAALKQWKAEIATGFSDRQQETATYIAQKQAEAYNFLVREGTRYLNADPLSKLSYDLQDLNEAFNGTDKIVSVADKIKALGLGAEESAYLMSLATQKLEKDTQHLYQAFADAKFDRLASAVNVLNKAMYGDLFVTVSNIEHEVEKATRDVPDDEKLILFLGGLQQIKNAFKDALSPFEEAVNKDTLGELGYQIGNITKTASELLPQMILTNNTKGGKAVTGYSNEEITSIVTQGSEAQISLAKKESLKKFNQGMQSYFDVIQTQGMGDFDVKMRALGRQLTTDLENVAELAKNSGMSINGAIATVIEANKISLAKLEEENRKAKDKALDAARKGNMADSFGNIAAEVWGIKQANAELIKSMNFTAQEVSEILTFQNSQIRKLATNTFDPIIESFKSAATQIEDMQKGLSRKNLGQDALLPLLQGDLDTALTALNSNVATYGKSFDKITNLTDQDIKNIGSREGLIQDVMNAATELYNFQLDAVNTTKQAVRDLYSFVRDLDKTVQSIRFGSLNVRSVEDKAGEAQKEFDRLRAQAFATGASTETVKAFQDFAQTYLGAQFANLKSQSSYLDLLDSVTTDLNNLGASVTKAQFGGTVEQLAETVDKLGTEASSTRQSVGLLNPALDTLGGTLKNLASTVSTAIDGLTVKSTQFAAANSVSTTPNYNNTTSSGKASNATTSNPTTGFVGTPIEQITGTASSSSSSSANNPSQSNPYAGLSFQQIVDIGNKNQELANINSQLAAKASNPSLAIDTQALQNRAVYLNSLPKMASGGRIFGRTHAEGGEPRILEKDEFVFDAQSSNRLGFQALDQLRKGNLQLIERGRNGGEFSQVERFKEMRLSVVDTKAQGRNSNVDLSRVESLLTQLNQQLSKLDKDNVSVPLFLDLGDKVEKRFLKLNLDKSRRQQQGFKS